MRTRNIVVTGAGGFIGHHLCTRLTADRHHVTGIDIREPPFEPNATEFRLGDLRNYDSCAEAVDGADWVFQLAADMGGIGYLHAHRSTLARNNATINMNMLEASARAGVERYFFPSSACIYPKGKQTEAQTCGLRETDALPADPEPGYGWEKLFTEHVTGEYARERRLNTRIARFHNIYGPVTTYDGGREKAPAALCRKVALADPGAEGAGKSITIWGDGKQTRTFCYVDDCIEAMLRLMESECNEPVNIGSEELITIDGLALLIAEIAGKRITLEHDTGAPQGVRGRASDNGALLRATGYAPRTPLAKGLIPTYEWIERQVRRSNE